MTYTAWRSTPLNSKLIAASEIVALDERGKAFTIRLAYDVIGRAKAANKTVVTYLSNRLSDALAAEGLDLPRLWFVVEKDSPTDLHLHGAVAIEPSDMPALRRAFRRFAGEFTTTARQFAIKIDDFDQGRSFGGHTGPAGWAAYAAKDLGPMGRRLGSSPAYISRPLLQTVRDAHLALRAMALPEPMPLEGATEPAERFVSQTAGLTS